MLHFASAAPFNKPVVMFASKAVAEEVLFREGGRRLQKCRLYAFLKGTLLKALVSAALASRKLFMRCSPSPIVPCCSTPALLAIAPLWSKSHCGAAVHAPHRR